jgi:positive regulator of sigma E activity
MKKSYLNRGIICVLAGLCFLLAAVFTESVFDGLLWGFAGGALGPGIGWIIQHFYWSAPKNQERYREIQEQEDINLHDELNEKLRDKSGRIAYNIGLLIICISEVVFSILGKTGVITDYKIIVLYLFSLFIFQIVIGFVVYHQLRRKY